MIEPVDVFWKCNKGYLGVTHPLPNGDILIANVGDPAGNAKGEFSCQHSHFPAEIPVSGARLCHRRIPRVSQVASWCWTERPLS